MYENMHAYMYIFMYVYVCMCMHVYVCVCMYSQHFQETGHISLFSKPSKSRCTWMKRFGRSLALEGPTPCTTPPPTPHVIFCVLYNTAGNT